MHSKSRTSLLFGKTLGLCCEAVGQLLMEVLCSNIEILYCCFTRIRIICAEAVRTVKLR